MQKVPIRACKTMVSQQIFRNVFHLIHLVTFKSHITSVYIDIGLGFNKIRLTTNISFEIIDNCCGVGKHLIKINCLYKTVTLLCL